MWSRIAHAVIRRLGSPPELVVEFHANLAGLHFRFARYVEAGFATQVILNARLTRFYERDDWKRRLNGAQGNEPLLLERGIDFDDPEPQAAEVPVVTAISGGASTIEIAARMKLAEVKAKTEQQAGGKVKTVTVDELHARRKAAKPEITP